MIRAMEVVSIRLPRTLTVDIRTVCAASRQRKGKEKLNLSEFIRLAVERELKARRRNKRYSEQRRGSACSIAGGVLTPLMPDPSS
jgi:predicted DNA-binding ribbon-helix-helix protein